MSLNNMDFIQGENFIKLANNENIYYSHTHDVNSFFKTINFNHDFILISHNSDGSVTNNPVSNYDADIRNAPKNLKKWYAQNVNVIDERVESIPNGLENSKWFPEIKKIEKLKNIINYPKNIINLVYLNLNILNNPKVRQPIYDMLTEIPYVTTHYGRNGISYDTYLTNLYNHKFMICPKGNGIDVHQPWESLYVNTIPIQKKNINNSNWGELPICWLDEWDQLLDEDFLNSEYERITNNLFDKSKIYFDYWENKIKKSI